MKRIEAALARAKALADAMGPGDPDFDMKAYTDELWETPRLSRGHKLIPKKPA